MIRRAYELKAKRKLHIEERTDGFYVVGEGWLIPVLGKAEGNKIIGIMRQKKS
jgi:hypothetical protein